MNVPIMTLVQHWAGIGSLSRACCVITRWSLGLRDRSTWSLFGPSPNKNLTWMTFSIRMSLLSGIAAVDYGGRYTVSLKRNKSKTAICWANVGPPSSTVDQHWLNIGSTCPVMNSIPILRILPWPSQTNTFCKVIAMFYLLCYQKTQSPFAVIYISGICH